MPRTKLDRTCERVGVLKNAIRALFSECSHFGHDFKNYLSLYSTRVLESYSYKMLPRWAVSEIQGYRDASYDCFEKYCLEGRWTIDGITLYVNGQEKEAAFAGRWNDVKYCGAFHKGTLKHWNGGDAR